MSEFNVSTRYAKALIELSEEQNNFDVVSREMDFVENTLRNSPELRKVIASPVIEISKKTSIIEAVFKEHISQEVLNFLLFLINKNRDKVFYDIVKRFSELRDEKTGVANVTITAAVDLPEDEKAKIVSKFESYSGLKIRAQFGVDENIIGGFLVRIGDTVVDATVVNQLEKLKKQLKAAAVE